MPEVNSISKIVTSSVGFSDATDNGVTQGLLSFGFFVAKRNLTSTLRYQCDSNFLNYVYANVHTDTRKRSYFYIAFRNLFLFVIILLYLV